MGKQGKLKESAYALIAFTVLGVLPLKATYPSVAFISPNFKHCAGHCEAQNINCDKSTQEHGSYHWCKANCVSPTKGDLQKYQEGIASCHAAPLDSLKTS
jgi:hypothetical protein